MAKTLAEIKVELDNKFSSPLYTCNSVLDSNREIGTVWKLEYSETQSGKRRAEFDGLILRNHAGVTYAYAQTKLALADGEF